MLYSLTRLLVGFLVRSLYRPIVRGRSNVPRRSAVIIASNHLSFIDSVVITLLAPRPVCFLTKDARM
jgi:1-acyl-sn-glycerol-3-phosphate acyltransferase